MSSLLQQSLRRVISHLMLVDGPSLIPPPQKKDKKRSTAQIPPSDKPSSQSANLEQSAKGKRGIPLSHLILLGRSKSSGNKGVPNEANQAAPQAPAAQAGKTLTVAKKTNLKPKKQLVTIRSSNAFSLYLFRILKTVRDDTGISKKGMNLLNQLIANAFEEIMKEARNLVLYQKKQTMGTKDIETAVKLYLVGELKKQALSRSA